MKTSPRHSSFLRSAIASSLRISIPRTALLPAALPVCSALFVLTGCNAPEPQIAAKDEATANQQTAFRVRSDFAAELNDNSGWAAELNKNVTVDVDEPFRLRFEVESTKENNVEQQFQLQSRRNGGEWERVGAENFPQPEKTLELNFQKAPTADLSDIWRFEHGNTSSMTMAGQGEVPFLQVVADGNPVLGMGLYETFWEPIEFAVEMRLPEGGRSGAGVVFGYMSRENYNQAYVDPDGAIIVSRIVDGDKTRLMETEAKVVPGQWFELKIIMKDDEAIIEYERGDDALIFTAELGATIASSPVGFYVPADGTAQFQKFTIEGKPRTPRVSIMASDTYLHRQQTTDVLAGSSKDFTGGTGISFADETPSWSGELGQSEWEWPLVIRRFADGAVTNEDGDTFEFRMADATGRALDGNNPELTVAVPPGHIGGTFAETPARIGPWQAANGDLYFLMEPSETDNVLMTIKSTDHGKTWQEVDGANRPVTGDLEGFASVQSGDTIHMLHQTTDHVWHHAFHTSDHPTRPDTWAIQDERLASPEEPPTQVADIVLRSDGSIVGVYGGPEKIHFKVRSPDGRWGEETVIDADVSWGLSGPMMVLGKDDVIHLAYTASNGTAWYRRMLPNGDLTARQRLATGLGTDSEDIGSVLPLVFMAQTNTVSIIYRLETGKLWERRSVDHGPMSESVQVSDRNVVQNSVDSDQTGADAIADGNTVHVLFIEEESRIIFHTYSESAGNWTPATPQVEDVNAQWVRGAQLARGGKGSVYGYVYDAGADGGSGKSRYGNVKLEDN